MFMVHSRLRIETYRDWDWDWSMGLIRSSCKRSSVVTGHVFMTGPYQVLDQVYSLTNSAGMLMWSCLWTVERGCVA